MSGSYSQIYIHLVIAVNGRENILSTKWRNDLFKYMSGIIKAKGHKPLIVNGVGDHVHLFVGQNPSKTLSDLVRDIKNNSSNFINKQGWIKARFSWQVGYGAFSYSQSQISDVYNYIKNQESHHAKRTFKEEYISFLDKFQIDYDKRYLFEWQ